MNVSGAYTSRKMGVTIQFESHKVELWVVYLMEYDAQVFEYFDQASTLTLEYESLSGRKVVAQHTPDFLSSETMVQALRSGSKRENCWSLL